MVDAPEQENEILKLLFGVDALGDALRSIEDVLKSMVQKSMESSETAMRMLTGASRDSIQTIQGNLKQAFDVTTIVESQMASAKKLFQDLGSDVKNVFEDIGLQDVLVGLELDTNSLGRVRESIGELADENFVLNITAFMAGNEVLDQLRGVTRGIKSVEDDVLEVSRAGEAALRGMIAPLSDDRPYKDMAGGVAAFRNEILDTVMEFGLARSTAQEGFSELTARGLNIDQIQRLSLTTSESGESVKGLQAAFLGAYSSGLELADAANILNLRMRALGTDGAEAAGVFETLQRVQANTTLTTKNILDAIGSAQEQMKFFGDNTDNVAAIFKGFVDTLGRGREELARPLFDQVINGIQQLANSANMGTRAFIGMASGIGGGAGPIGAGLRVEEALTTGEGLDDVLGGIRDQIERFSGAQILTRREAIDTGQEQQFEIQRRLLQQFLGVTGAQEQNLVLESLRENDFAQIMDQLRPTGGGLTTGVAEDRISREVGAIDRATNRLEAIGAIGLSETASKDILEASSVINEGAKGFSDAAETLRETLEGGNFQGLLDIFRGGEARQERIAERARQEIPEAFDSEGPLGPSARALNSFSQAMDNTSVKSAAALNSFNEVLNNTGINTAASLNTLKESADNSGVALSSIPETIQSWVTPETIGELTDFSVNDRMSREQERLRDTRSQDEEGISSRSSLSEPMEKEVILKVKAEIDPNSGLINLIPAIENVATPIAIREAEARAGAPRE